MQAINKPSTNVRHLQPVAAPAPAMEAPCVAELDAAGLCIMVLEAACETGAERRRVIRFLADRYSAGIRDPRT